MLPRVLSWLLVIVASVVGTGCGPSLRMLHESTTYFERCHAAELSPAVPVEERYECWQRWLRWYSDGQEQARILYARERLVYLAQGEEIAPLPVADAGLDAAEPPSTAAEVATDGGAATSGGARTYDESLRARYRPNPRSQGNTVCEPLCRPRWDRCVDGCRDDARSCVAACEASHRACMQSCF